MKILAIDPGTKCGYALNLPKRTSGTWNLTPKRLEGPGMRYLRFRNELGRFVPPGLELIVFEEVRQHAGTAAAHVYGGIIAVLTSFCEEHSINYTSVPVGTWKKVVLGKGNAKKSTVLDFVKKSFNPKCLTYDEADAICILEYAERQYTPDHDIFS